MIGIPQMFDFELGRRAFVAAIQVPSLSSSAVYSHNLHFVMAYGQLCTYVLGFIATTSNYGSDSVFMELVVNATLIPALAEGRPRRVNHVSKQTTQYKRTIWSKKKIMKKMPKVLLTRKSSSQYTLPLTL